MMWSIVIGKILTTVMSWIDASNLRNTVNKLREENKIMRTTLEDIQRMDVEGRMGWHAKRTIDIVNGLE